MKFCRSLAHKEHEDCHRDNPGQNIPYHARIRIPQVAEKSAAGTVEALSAKMAREGVVIVDRVLAMGTWILTHGRYYATVRAAGQIPVLGENMLQFR